MTDTIEAVARAIANASADVWENRGVCTHPSTWYPEAQAAIASHTKALIEQAGEVAGELDVLHVWPQSIADHHADILTPRQIERLYDVGTVATRAAATIAALRAENERAKEEGVRAGIEASAGAADAIDTFDRDVRVSAWAAGRLCDAVNAIRALDAAAIAKGV